MLIRRIVALLVVALVGISLFAGGGQETGEQEIVFIPKLVGIPWFNAMEQGLRDYADEIGGLKVTVAGAPDTDPAAQARILEDTIAKGPAAIVVVPNDTRVLEPIMKKGLDAGILMVSQEASSIQNAVVDIEFLIPERYGRDMVELLVREAGEVGGYAIMVGGLTVESHNQRADNAVKYQESAYPGLYQVTSRLEGSESVQEAHDKTLELLQAYDDIIGAIYIGSLGGIGAAQAIDEKGAVDIFSVVAGSVPSQAKSYLQAETISANYISNPYRIGRDTTFIVKHLLDGGAVADVSSLPEFGAVQISGKVITFHAPSEVTAENADAFGF